MQAYLVLEDGSVFAGESLGATGRATGELVFTTSMTGYQEILTDPSYAGQIVLMDGLEAVLEAPREQVSRVASEILQSLPVYDITIEEVDIDEIIRDIFAGKREAGALVNTAGS